MHLPAFLATTVGIIHPAELSENDTFICLNLLLLVIPSSQECVSVCAAAAPAPEAQKVRSLSSIGNTKNAS